MKTKRVVYRIETQKIENKIDRRQWVKTYKDLRELREKIDALIKAQKRVWPTKTFNNPLRWEMCDLKSKLGFEKYTVEKQVVRVDKFGEKRAWVENGSLRNALATIREKVRQERRERKERRVRYGSRVHMHFGEILERAYGKALDSSKYPKTNEKYIGVEIECIVPNGATYKKALYPFREYVGVGTDGSIRPESGEMGIEIRILATREKIGNVVKDVCKAIKELGGRVNTSCGLHVHLDCRREVTNEEEVRKYFNNLVKSQNRLYDIVPPSRKGNTYCKKNRGTDFNRALRMGRYHAINMASLRRHQTIEVRLFGGTLQEEKINNWISLLVGIAEGEPLKSAVRTWKSLGKKFKLSNTLVTWAEKRKKEFSDVGERTESDSENQLSYQDIADQNQNRTVTA